MQPVACFHNSVHFCIALTNTQLWVQSYKFRSDLLMGNSSSPHGEGEGVRFFHTIIGIMPEILALPWLDAL